MGALIFWRAGTPSILRPIWLAEKLPPEEQAELTKIKYLK